MRAYLGLGSNLGDREAVLEMAVHALNQSQHIAVTKFSSVYETEPWGGVKQEPFLNQVVEIETDLAPINLLSVCQKIEIDSDRRKTVKWGPRTLDIDILLYGTQTVQTDDVVIPHPRMAERKFVLVPLAEIAPDVVIAGVGQTVQQVLLECSDKGLVKRFYSSEAGVSRSLE